MAPFISRLVCAAFYREARCVCSRFFFFLNKLFRHRNSSHRYGDQRNMSYISPFFFFSSLPLPRISRRLKAAETLPTF